jgi:hypothetical protein
VVAVGGEVRAILKGEFMSSPNLSDNYISTVANELLDECEFARQHSESFSQITFAHIQRMRFSKAMFEDKTLLSARTLTA